MTWIDLRDEEPPEHHPLLVCWAGGEGRQVDSCVVKRTSSGNLSWRRGGTNAYYKAHPTHWMKFPDHVDKEVGNG